MESRENVIKIATSLGLVFKSNIPTVKLEKLIQDRLDAINGKTEEIIAPEVNDTFKGLHPITGKPVN